MLETGACWIAKEGYLTGSGNRLKPIHQKYNFNCGKGFSMWLDWWLEREVSE